MESAPNPPPTVCFARFVCSLCACHVFCSCCRDGAAPCRLVVSRTVLDGAAAQPPQRCTLELATARRHRIIDGAVLQARIMRTVCTIVACSGLSSGL
eukprot:2821113-Pleurochrysis_carterae.AAC.16